MVTDKRQQFLLLKLVWSELRAEQKQTGFFRISTKTPVGDYSNDVTCHAAMMAHPENEITSVVLVC